MEYSLDEANLVEQNFAVVCKASILQQLTVLRRKLF